MENHHFHGDINEQKMAMASMAVKNYQRVS